MSLPHCLLRFVPNSQTLVKTQEPQQPYSKIIMTSALFLKDDHGFRGSFLGCKNSKLRDECTAWRCLLSRMDTQAEIKVRMRTAGRRDLNIVQQDAPSAAPLPAPIRDHRHPSTLPKGLCPAPRSSNGVRKYCGNYFFFYGFNWRWRRFRWGWAVPAEEVGLNKNSWRGVWGGGRSAAFAEHAAWFAFVSHDFWSLGFTTFVWGLRFI